VEAFLRGNTRADIRVARQTFQRALAPELMASRAVCRAIQRFVRMRKRAGRDLCVRSAREQKDTQCRKKPERRKMPLFQFSHVRVSLQPYNRTVPMLI
jgi:hypothetical protein